MRIRCNSILMIVLGLGCQLALAEESPSQSEFKVPSHWAGSWEVSAEANKLLGYASDEDRVEVTWDHPTSFALSFDAKIGESFETDILDTYREQVFNQMQHRIVATGKWKTKFEVDPGIESNCFLTVKNGVTCLWVPAPFVVIYGGKVSFLQGVNKKQDLLVINFNSHEKQVRHHDTVVFRRVAEKREREQPQEVSDTEAPLSERIQTVRKTYRAVPPDILGVKEPIKVLWGDMLFDGGSIFVKAEDAEGKIFHATLKFDVSYLKINSESESAWVENYRTQEIQFDFSKNVNSGPYYPIRGPEESAIYGLLIRWSEHPNYESTGEESESYRKHWADLFLKAMDHRFATLPVESE